MINNNIIHNNAKCRHFSEFAAYPALESPLAVKVKVWGRVWRTSSLRLHSSTTSWSSWAHTCSITKSDMNTGNAKTAKLLQ